MPMGLMIKYFYPGLTICHSGGVIIRAPGRGTTKIWHRPTSSHSCQRWMFSSCQPHTEHPTWPGSDLQTRSV